MNARVCVRVCATCISRAKGEKVFLFAAENREGCPSAISRDFPSHGFIPHSRFSSPLLFSFPPIARVACHCPCKRDPKNDAPRADESSRVREIGEPADSRMAEDAEGGGRLLAECGRAATQVAREKRFSAPMKLPDYRSRGGSKQNYSLEIFAIETRSLFTRQSRHLDSDATLRKQIRVTSLGVISEETKGSAAYFSRGS